TDRRQYADAGAIAIDRLLAPRHELRLVELEQQQPPREAALALGHERVAPDESARLVPGDRERHARLERRLHRRQLLAPRAIALLEAQRVERIVARVRHTAGARDRIVHARRIRRRHVQLPAQLAHIREAYRAHADTGDIDVTDAAVRERVVAEISA